MRHNPDIPVPAIRPDPAVVPIQPVSVHRAGAPARVWLSTVRALYRQKIKARLARERAGRER